MHYGMKMDRTMTPTMFDVDAKAFDNFSSSRSEDDNE